MASPQVPDGGPVRVLIVEDAMDHAHLLMALLKRLGPFEATHSQDGDQAIRLLDKRPFELVITDLNLPGTDGFDVIRHVRATQPDIPVLATTGYTNPQYETEAFRAGANDLIHKPIDPEELQRKIGELVRSEAVKPHRPPAIMAVGAHIGDVELGCGGTLLKHVAEGRDVLILTLGVVDDDEVAQARAAAEHVGARIILARNAVGNASDLQEVQGLVERIAKELKPIAAFTPSLGDDDPDRREAHRLCRLAFAEVPEVLAYPTATTTMDFRPHRFEDVTDQMLAKSEALLVYRPLNRRELTPRFAQAAARWWGRFADFGEVEPFEVLRGAEVGDAS